MLIPILSCWATQKEPNKAEVPAEQSKTNKKLYKPKGLLNPYIDNFLADDSVKKHSTIKTMRLDELYPAKNRYIKEGKTEFAKVTLERIITLENNQTKLKNARLELAQLYYEVEEYENAQKAYSEFAELYPGSKKREFAQYKAIACSCKQIDTSDRDQTSTHAAAKMAKCYLDEEDCTQYRKEINSLCNMCYEKLVEHELGVAHFYAQKNKPEAARKRVDYIKKNYLADAPQTKNLVEELEAALGAPPVVEEEAPEVVKATYASQF